jgi:hypothetical protein
MPTIRPNHTVHQIPFPAGAVCVDEWDDLDTDTPSRYFRGQQRIIERPDRDEDIEVRIDGIQHIDGSVQREIVVHELHHNEPITVEQARHLAIVLSQAADEVERMANHDHISHFAT